MAAERGLNRSTIVVSVLLHAAVIVPVLLTQEPPGLAEGMGTTGLVVTFAASGGATGASGAEVPDIETIDAGPNPDEVSATMVAPEEVAAEAEPEPVDTEVVTAVEPPIAEPEPVAAAEPTTTVTAATPDAAAPEPAPVPAPPAQTPSETAEVPLEEIQAQPPPQQAGAPAEPVETVPAADSATAAKAQEPPKEKPAEKSTKRPPAKSDSIETAERTTTTGEQRADEPKTKAGHGGDGSADSGSGVAALDSSIRRGMADYQFLLQAWLEKHKKYPRRAKQRHWQGTVMLHFIIDRSGNVLSYRIQESSGHEVLDEEVEAMIRRATPLPPVPQEMQSARLEFVVPVQFFLK
jgi:periplasmic protein TonB